MSVPAKRQAVRSALRRNSASRCAQHGATAVEFAMVFPMFFAIFYAIVTFSLIFVAQQSLTLATEEGARAALSYQPASSVAAAITLRAKAACNTATNMVAPMIGNAKCTTVPAACSFDSTMQCIAVTLNYNYASSPLVPNLPVLGAVLPNSLSSTATVQLNPINIL
ncbi:TadE/TadG family type IV pilus assembly protein [Paraburkholderia megapolitana]|uniref:Flp pilus assembly protein TadG n=1 Tax=Paraburkholderia megapolitana TaxID=420953 RepID=A0A1I3R9C6_9BURK|nr:TadE/TadG family type IV pilus assembly protein [Paraburkholderia megapolitana]QDQ83723.1 pilus assembly protein [Paraburkholderia megapolitana]SFJ41947.1 Flp pilus assembly protein TadG [Paraburkholderia megapolitana]